MGGLKDGSTYEVVLKIMIILNSKLCSFNLNTFTFLLYFKMLSRVVIIFNYVIYKMLRVPGVSMLYLSSDAFHEKDKKYMLNRPLVYGRVEY